MIHLGHKIRARRRELKRTIQDLADSTGLSIAFISQVERNITVPSLTSLTKIAREIGVSIGDLAGSPGEPHSVTYSGQRRQFTLDMGSVKYERLSSEFPGSKLHSLKFTMPYGYRSEHASHEGEDFFYVLKGCITFKVGDENINLSEGDSIHIDANVPHSVAVLPSDLGFAEVLWGGTMNIFGNENHVLGREVNGLKI